MPTDDALYSRFGKLSDQALLTLLASEESDGLTSAEFRALTEELVRRGLRKSAAPSVPIEKAAPEGRIHPKASLTRRIIAAGIDAAIVVIAFVVMWSVIFMSEGPRHEDAGGIIALPIILATFGYIFLRDARRGQSIGKRAAEPPTRRSSRCRVITLSSKTAAARRDCC